MSNLTTAWMLGCVCGFFLGVTAQGWRRRSTCRELMRERQPTFADLLMPPPRDRDPDWRRSFSHENTNQPSGPPSPDRKPPAPPAPPPLVGHAGWFINNPVQIAECGGPCTSGPSHCDCGALWLDLPSAKAIADKSWAEARRATFIDPSLAAGPPRLSH